MCGLSSPETDSKLATMALTKDRGTLSALAFCIHETYNDILPTEPQQIYYNEKKGVLVSHRISWVASKPNPKPGSLKSRGIERYYFM